MSDSQNQSIDSLQEWRESAPYWKKYGPTIKIIFTPLTQALVEDARISTGQSVLDVAGGPGEPSLTIAKLVGPEGFVMCTDAVAEMVETAEHEAQRQGITNIQFRQCAAESLPFEDSSFNAVVCRLGAMFFPDTPAALREMLRVTKPSGSVALAVWNRSEANPFASIANDIISRYVPSDPAVPAGHDTFRYAEAGVLANLLKEAGSIDVRERVFEFHIVAPISPAEFWTMRSEMSDTLRGKLATLSTADRERVGSEVQTELKSYFSNNQMNFSAEMRLVSGSKKT